MNKDNYYKLLQVSEILINNYSYNQIVIKDYSIVGRQESWFSNPNAFYNVIRVSFSSPQLFEYEKKRISDYLDFLSTIYKTECKFLDIHIVNEEYDSSLENYDYINIDDNYSSGKDVSKIFPELYSCIHYVANENEEIVNITNRLIKTVQNRQQLLKKPHNKKYFVTYLIIFLCTINFIINLFLSKYGAVETYVFLGADYKTFTLGLKQLYRLLTCGFVHSGVVHYFCNMYSFLSLGKYIEQKYGHSKLLIALLSCVIFASLAHGILSENAISVGLSGGIYGLLVIYLLDLRKSHYLNLSVLLPVVIINAVINVISDTAWIAHLGGAICGYLIYLLYNNQKKSYIFLFIICISVMFIKYLTIKSINPFYIGTDFSIIDLYQKLGLNKSSDKLLKQLLNVYDKYGG